MEVVTDVCHRFLSLSPEAAHGSLPSTMAKLRFAEQGQGQDPPATIKQELLGKVSS